MCVFPCESTEISFYSIFKNNYISLFLERGEGREKEGEKHQQVASCTNPNGDWACNPVMCTNGEQTGDLLLCGTMLIN